MQPPEPTNEHKWLQKLVGKWTSEMEYSMGPGQPTMKSTGRETVRSLGGLWMLCDGEGDMPEGAGTGYTQMMLGFDPKKGKFIGTFVGSMMTYWWIYEGSLDAAGNKLVLDTEGPNFADDTKTAKYQDAIEFVSDDHRILTSAYQMDDGSWTHFMTAHYRRVK